MVYFKIIWNKKEIQFYDIYFISWLTTHEIYVFRFTRWK